MSPTPLDLARRLPAALRPPAPIEVVPVVPIDAAFYDHLVRRDPALTADAVAVGCTLAGYAAGAGTAALGAGTPTLRALAQASRVPRGHVRPALRCLEERGWISRPPADPGPRPAPRPITLTLPPHLQDREAPADA